MEKKKVPPIGIISIVIILAVGLFACHESNQKRINARDTFEEMAKDTVSTPLYKDIIEDYYVDGPYVAVHVYRDKWDAASSEKQQEFMKEICLFLKNDAIKSGILEYNDIIVSFYRTKTDRINMFTIKK